ncbi:BCCT family transporter [Marinobacter salexigens]|uniref:BCCT family transporter n=1 Tax=Marinobacter salexigens TaxID=1925763 RepID=A0ABS6A7T6_9GAMM|nr:BCCT family transporter [Marinobacter salexigens]MBU2874081.1 BCCT family transporter [Marinobacter salexigens]
MTGVERDSNGFLGDYDKPLFFSVALVTMVVVLFGVISPDVLKAYAGKMHHYLSSTFGWSYILAISTYVALGLWVGFSKYGNLKLGKAEDKPEFTRFSWVAMLFSCGIGSGFVLWGVAEPLYHYMQTPYMAEPGTPKAMEVSLQIASMHWGLHSWMGYCVVGLCIAFPAFRYGKPMNIGTSLHGLLGDKTQSSIWARLLDLIGAVATIGGIATVVGLGVISLEYGVQHLFGIQTGTGSKIGIMVTLIVLYCISVCTGLKRGINFLSTLNVVVMIGICLFVFMSGDTNTILRLFVTGIGNYLGNILPMAFWADPGNSSEWINHWTLFFWLIVISWAPFVGGFVARISRGRTLREFVLFAVLTPTVCSMFWFATIGTTAMQIEVAGHVQLFEAVKQNLGSGIYLLLETLPAADLMAPVVFFSMVVFLITSADSASFFVAMQMSKGALDPTLSMKLVWGVFTGVLAVVLLVSGGLQAVQTASIVAGSPFAIGIGFMIWSLLKSLRHEYDLEFGAKSMRKLVVQP